MEYNENDTQYNIMDNTLDSRTGKTYSMFKKEKLNMNDFHPATFILITGSVDESGEDIPEIKQKIIRQIFNNVENKEGKLLKFVLGSRVMNEGITLENTREVHILDVHYNLGKVDQVIGRAIRMCKHMALVSDTNHFPKVNIYRYVVGVKDKLSTDEILYQKAELKYILVKNVERLLKEVAIDCPMLLHGNKFPEEIEEYKGCVEPTLENVKKGKKICPAICDFKECDFKCDDMKLNEFYDNKNKTYKSLDPDMIDHSTFNDTLAKTEIDIVKQKWGIDLPVDKSNRRPDFVIYKNNKIYWVETNFYSGGGSKLKSTCGEYKFLFDFCKNNNVNLIWITDGNGWNTCPQPLKETFLHTDYVFNLTMLKDGVLNEILK
jgi:hypothetical protein